ncbi:hypothetical protein IMZ31_23940 (plasmid) [Pontibacillus sp. ALD_SL1]|uniref:beta barrel domain-containing protein n=1 Tax=Pontibacillus sp. ALD_SL1 TaxID=2777185 RepID=UPI001A963A36|nr:hypothetical protein [Pontibacillus sp. ALD_SL1]QST02505.1 hypothetical protein IMZ31_23940 [Pontibacillus sp. ALD_SL1]
MGVTKEDFRKGQEVALKHINNEARYREGMTKGIVKTIGRKYVTVEICPLSSRKKVLFKLSDHQDRVFLSQKTDFSPDYLLFPSEQAYQDYEEKEKLLGEIREVIQTYGGQDVPLTLDQLRRTKAILDESERD